MNIWTLLFTTFPEQELETPSKFRVIRTPQLKYLHHGSAGTADSGLLPSPWWNQSSPRLRQFNCGLDETLTFAGRNIFNKRAFVT